MASRRRELHLGGRLVWNGKGQKSEEDGRVKHTRAGEEGARGRVKANLARGELVWGFGPGFWAIPFSYGVEEIWA